MRHREIYLYKVYKFHTFDQVFCIRSRCQVPKDIADPLAMQIFA